LYAFKKLVGVLFSPLTLALLLVLLGLLLRWWNRGRAATIVFCSAALFAWLISTPLVGTWLLAPLESQYPAQPSYPEVRFVAVLGSSYTPGPGIPLTAAVDEAGMRRLLEGMRIQRLMPAAKLLVSGGSPHPGRAPASGNALLAESLGMSPDLLVRLDQPLDTQEEARALAAYTQGQRFILVTSAAHMPRAMEYLRRAGGRPIAAPTGQRARTEFAAASLLPGAGGLAMSAEAVHEYLGWLALMAGLG
jgi:uncharacterized SAM-binding protein YcdF (DUF218 family)